MRSFKKAVDVYRNRHALRVLANNYLTFSKVHDRPVWGSLSPASRDELARLVAKAADFRGPIIEIGTLFGFTTQLLADVKAPDQELITVDNYSWNPFSLPPEQHRAFTRGALHYCIENASLTLFEGTSSEFFETYAGAPPALVFLDGSHSQEAVAEEIGHAQRLGASIICGDDYSESFPGLCEAVDEAFGDGITVNHSLWSVIPETSRDVSDIAG
jgi:hypothetical protein